MISIKDGRDQINAWMLQGIHVHTNICVLLNHRSIATKGEPTYHRFGF